MPQGRHKVPFSNKQKKVQLQNKRKKKTGFFASDVTEEKEKEKVRRINEQPHGDGRSQSNKYALQFFNETKEEIQKRKELGRQTVVPVSEEHLEIDINKYFPPELDFPRRPSWIYGMTKEELDVAESRYFNEYVKSIQRKFKVTDMSYFELNLETWRQLWRVLEMSDIILFIVDIRYPALMFPPSVYSYVVETLEKELILVLNKADLASAELVVAWKYYFITKFPSIHIVMFTSYPSYNLHGNLESTSAMRSCKRRGRMKMAVEGAQNLQETCQEIVKGEMDISSWKKKIIEDKFLEYDERVEIREAVESKPVDTNYHEHMKYRDGVLTIGCVGQPNAGKSSVINALMGKKVVSVSKTPGHTKHFQTIFITPNVKLCDCPGLVFPSKVPKELQILMGSFPIAQLREPYTTVRYLAERLDLVQMLHIQHPDDDDEWSAMDICDGWAKSRGYYTSRAARLDTNRAANHLLRLALEGTICLCLRPPGYSKKKDFWKNHPEINEILWIQAKSGVEGSSNKFERIVVSTDEEEVHDENQETDDSECEGDSDIESGDESIAAVKATNKFAVLAEDY